VFIFAASTLIKLMKRSAAIRDDADADIEVTSLFMRWTYT
jgi:hypothetical protein